MPWQETQSVDKREQFIDDVQHGRMPVLQLCAHYGVSRKTGYKWMRVRKGARDSRTGAAPRTTVRTRWRRSSRSCSARCG
jgi:hypothetical protein